MPHLIIRGIAPEIVRTISKPLTEELANVCQCPLDYFVLECLHTTALFDGEIVPSSPFVEVNWFDRGQAVRDLAAECIDRHIRSRGIVEVEIAFRIYEENSYYANGTKLAATEEDETTKALRAENQRLKDELAKVRKTLQAQQTNSASQMSSRLYDALRE
jgi:hypothetical protein